MRFQVPIGRAMAQPARTWRSRPLSGELGMRAFASMCAAMLMSFGAIGPGAASEAQDLFGLRLYTVRFDSDRPVDEEALRGLMALPIGRPLTAGALDRARHRLALKRIFRRIEIGPVAELDGVTVVVRLQRKPVIEGVSASGHGRLSSEEMRRLTRLRTGMIFEPEEIEAAQARIRGRYERMGFVHARVESRTREDGGRIDVELRVTEGAPLVVAAAVVDGVANLPQMELQDVLNDMVGAPRASNAGRNGERRLVRRLREEGYYEARVSSRWEEGPDDQGVLVFSVAAGPRFVIDVSGNEHRSRTRLLGLMNLLDRLIVTDGTWRELARRMAREYRAAGFYRVKVAVRIEEGDPKRVHLTVSEGRRYRIRALVFEGNHQISDGRLREKMMTRPAGWFPWRRRGVLIDGVLDDDLRRLRSFYRAQGFASAEIVETRRVFDEEQGSVDVTVVIAEGPRTVVHEIHSFDAAALLGRDLELRVRVGSRLSPGDIEADRRTIVGALSAAGYAQARVEANVEREAKGDEIAAVVRWQVEAGSRQGVGAIVVQGNAGTRDRVILRELPFEPGGPLDTAALLEGQARVYQLGLFRSVSVRPISPEDEAVRDVGVDVSERPPGSLQWGVGYNTRDGLGSFLEVAYDNLGGMARRISARGQFSLEPKELVPSQYLLNLGYREPRLRGSEWRWSSNLINERSTRSVDNFNVERVSVTTGLDRELRPRVQGGMEWQAEVARVFDVEQGAVLTCEDEGTSRTITVSPFVVYDGRDDAFAPRRGLLDSVRLRYGVPKLSSVHFVKLTLRHTQYIPLGEHVTLLYSGRLGWARAMTGDDSVPIRERFFLGGRTTVRGFEENSIGPRGRDESEVGGDVAINANLELWMPLAYGFGAALFVDGGGLFLQKCGARCRADIDNAAITFDNFRRSAGLGLRYQTPIGPLKLDYGIKLDRRASESFGRLHFSIGATF